MKQLLNIRIKVLRKVLLGLLLWFPLSSLVAQTYGNEWIHYEQPYLRFPVYTTGVHRIYYSSLDSALTLCGFNIDNINPAYFQIWGRGAQIPVYIETGTDQLFNQQDYIEFYAEKNDGYFDVHAYQTPLDQVNPFTSLFSDTLMYFFSFNAVGGNPRLSDEVYPAYQNIPSLNWIWVEQTQVFNEYYAPGKRYPTSDPETTLGDAAYTPAEGYTGSRFYPDWTQNRTLAAPGLYLQGQPAMLSFAATGGCNRVTPTQTVHLKAMLGNQVLLDSVFSNYTVFKIENKIISNTFLNANSQLQFRHIPVPGQNLHEWISVPWMKLKYARNCTFSNATAVVFNLPDLPSTGYHHVKTNGFVVNPGDTLRLFDLSNSRRIRCIPEAGYYHALIPDGPGEERCYLSSDSRAVRIKSLKPVGNHSGFFPNLKSAQFLAQKDYLMITHDSLWTDAENYAEYRAAEGFPVACHPLLLNIDDVYDQFAQGIVKNPIAIRNLVRFAWNYFPVKPKALFLIGKGLGSESCRFNSSNWRDNLVPVFGSPPSDWLYVLGTADTILFPVGRLSAAEPADLKAYLDKVKRFELSLTLPHPSAKNVLNFGGGSNSFEQDIFRHYLETYTSLLEKPFYGGNIRSFYKTSPDPIQINQSQLFHSILEDEGIRLLNYFGHASGVSFDMSLGDPAAFNNKDKYYFVVANSCWAGDIYGYHNGVSSERYVLIPEKGAIGYLASVTEGEPPYLHAFTREFYQIFSNLQTRLPVGNITMSAINSILQNPAMSGFSYRESAQEFCLHADPLLVIQSDPFPDYSLRPDNTTPARITFSPALITPDIDSFDLSIIHGNYGLALDTAYFIRIQRLNGNLTLSDTLIRCKAPLFNDTLVLRFPVWREIAFGENQFVVTLDALQEVNENGLIGNNTDTASVEIRSWAVIPVWPSDFAVVPELPLSCKSTTADPLAPELEYVFQLDTTDLFNSPVRQQLTKIQSGGLIEWNPDFPVITDSIVYFWRCAPLIQNQPDTSLWIQHSFQYIPQRRGWAQDHFAQFKDDDYRYITYNRDSLRFDFVQDFKTLFASTYIYGHVWQNELFKLNGSVMDIWSCAETRCSSSCGIKFAVFDPVSFQHWISYDQGNGYGQYGNRHCRYYPVGAFDFCTYFPSDRQEIVNFLDTIPEGFYVLAFSHRNHQASKYEESVYQAFESIGSGIIRQIKDTSAYIIIGRKGMEPGEALEAGLQAASDSLISLEASYPTAWHEGSITSSLIGPASQWESLHWKVYPEAGDSVRLRVTGIQPDGTEVVLIDGLPPDSADVINLQQRIDPGLYPWIRLHYFARDTLNSSTEDPDPARLERWQVVYQEVPETMVDPQAAFFFHQDRLQQGDSLKLTIAFHNISLTGMDSLRVHYWLESGEVSDTIVKRKLRPHPAGDILIDSIAMQALLQPGTYSLRLELNPFPSQPERYHFNNFLDIPFTVTTDVIPPVMDVTFDGIHIRNGDYVSATPEIVIRLTDENPFLLLTDTLCIRLTHAFSGNPLNPVYYSGGNNTLVFNPETPGENACTAVFRPQHVAEGVYHLEAQGQDASLNSSGIEPYRIDYQVRFTDVVSSLINYPNPFSDLTWFSFTQSGSSIPDAVEIRIYDSFGRLVKTFDKSLFGDLHLGTNFCRLPWDGTSDAGYPLPSGVYPLDFKVFSKEKEIDHNPEFPAGPLLDIRNFKHKILIVR